VGINFDLRAKVPGGKSSDKSHDNDHDDDDNDNNNNNVGCKNIGQMYVD